LTHNLRYFQQIYIINLPHRRDRRREMAGQLKKIGLCFDSPGVRLFEAVRPATPDGFPSIGTRGCFLSHLSILRDACEKGFERILILEDDVNFAEDFVLRMGQVKAALEHVDWSIFYGGYAIRAPLQTGGDVAIVLAEPAVSIQNTHFIAFRGRAICDAVSFLETLLSRPPGDAKGGPMHVDGAYNWFRNEFPSRITLLSLSPLGYQRRSRTDIHALRWFDRIPGIRYLVSVMRSLGNDTLR
jgi:glycosyl transferase, family 25